MLKTGNSPTPALKDSKNHLTLLSTGSSVNKMPSRVYTEWKVKKKKLWNALIGLESFI